MKKPADAMNFSTAQAFRHLFETGDGFGSHWTPGLRCNSIDSCQGIVLQGTVATNDLHQAGQFEAPCLMFEVAGWRVKVVKATVGKLVRRSFKVG